MPGSDDGGATEVDEQIFDLDGPDAGQLQRAFDAGAGRIAAADVPERDGRRRMRVNARKSTGKRSFACL